MPIGEVKGMDVVLVFAPVMKAPMADILF
jgi:hypothetical protein